MGPLNNHEVYTIDRGRYIRGPGYPEPGSPDWNYLVQRGLVVDIPRPTRPGTITVKPIPDKTLSPIDWDKEEAPNGVFKKRKFKKEQKMSKITTALQKLEELEKVRSDLQKKGVTCDIRLGLRVEDPSKDTGKKTLSDVEIPLDNMDVSFGDATADLIEKLLGNILMDYKKLLFKSYPKLLTNN